ncbi:hypothetical protein ZYGR_0Z00110 [Zygosaccharomyces rouxii]|uniref:Zn(2)-C6 fungal-type domain-containing protein n=1 Tax=Zygosaccharomyces rouxii TaxID=4956 RepID=A0A1Q3A4K4_ZYGRO|nr:hypothetical protein ZYGR_0Z00110 [Zygosaccharomyces rouxii]
MSGKKSKKACEICKRRKKRCSGGLPCEYCVKIDKPRECVYHTRTSSKTVKVTERYVLNLKAKIKNLESRLATVSDDSSNANPSISSEEEDNGQTMGGNIDSSGNYRLGNSACNKFLFQLKDSLVNSCQLPDDIYEPDIETISLESSPNVALIQLIFQENCPSRSEAKRWISAAYNVIGADYMYIEPDYETKILDSLIWDENSRNANFVRYATEITRFFTYLALGCLFNEERSPENTRSKFPGLQYFETALKLQSELLKVYDMVANTSLVQSFLYAAYYALSLDKSDFAYLTIGSAIRMTFTLGLHKKTLTFTENRVFWLCFVYDRLVSVRFGLPLMINEMDIDVPLLTESERPNQQGLFEAHHFNSQVRLAKITTQIVRKIYTRNSFSFVQNCYMVLKELKHWLDTLPNSLKVDYGNFSAKQSRSTINLHINYNYTIIITTRPVFLYVFNKLIESGRKAEEIFPEKLLNTITILLESSVQAAQIQSLILTRLYYDGRMVSASFLDCHYIFNATIILIFAAFCRSMPNHTISFGCDINTLFERVQINLTVLQQISQFNIAACNFNKQLTEIIELISSPDLQVTLKGSFAKQSGYTESEQQSLEMPATSNFDMDVIRNLDLSRILDDIGDTGKTDQVLPFDNEDFMKYGFF